jgi:hypothetical protein
MGTPFQFDTHAITDGERKGQKANGTDTTSA